MKAQAMATMPAQTDDLGALMTALQTPDRRMVGPVERDGAIVYDVIRTPDDVPRGRIDSQEAGQYRLLAGDPDRYFDYVVGPQSWKAWLFPPRRRLWTARRTSDGFSVEDAPDHWPETVFFGVRPCELAALALQDRIFLDGPFRDPSYARRRARTWIVLVQCARSAATCFCAAMATGPRADTGFDLALTEGGRPRSARGRACGLGAGGGNTNADPAA